MTHRRLLASLLGLALVFAASFAFATSRTASGPAALAAGDCPPGYTTREERMRQERMERASERTRPFRGESRDEERLSDEVGADGPMQRIARGPACVNRKVPESQGELMAIQTDNARRSTGGVAETVKPGAYRAAVRDRTRLAAGRNTILGSDGTWKPAGTGPLIADDARFGEINGLGLGDLAGRISDFAYDPAGNRLFAAVGEGGVWQSDDQGATWRSIGDSLPTQAVGGIAFSPDAGGTLIITTGDSVFGGGGTFAGLGAYRKVLSGGDWQKATGVPDNIITFKVAVDPTDPRKVYAGTGAGLFRSTDAGATFTNVNLPTGRAGGKQAGAPLDPDCTGAAPTRPGCFQANMVTDVVVQGADNEATADDSPGAKGGSVVAVVGWRAGDKKSPVRPGFPTGYVESPNNGVYRSDTGAADTFDRIDNPTDFKGQGNIGRIELGLATGPEQDHNYLYAVMEDAARFNGAPVGIDVPGEGGPPAAVPNNTALNGIFVSDDFGESWTRMEDAEQLKNPTSGSALTGTACATQYCPGIQSWYNEWIAPDPTAQSGGVPTRVTFGLEEIWQNRVVTQPQNAPTDFKVVAPYFSGTSCLFLNADLSPCVTTAGDPTEANTTTHPDHHAAIYIPTGPDSARLVVGHDGGVNVQDVTEGEDVDPDGWGRGANQGFNTLLPYDAQVAKDDVIYAGLQDNGEMRIEPDGRQFMTYGGDGAFSAVDPDQSDTTYEGLPGGTINKSADGGKTYDGIFPDGDGTGDGDTFQFINPFTMDPRSAQHLITAGNAVYETDDGGANFEEVFSLGNEPSGAKRQMSAIDVRSPGDSGGGTPGPQTADVPEYEAGGDTVSGLDAGRLAEVPGTYTDKEFTIAPNERNGSATVEIAWGSDTDDWDLVVIDEQGNELASSAQGGTTSEKAVVASPGPGKYTVRVFNYLVAPGGTFKGTVKFAPASSTGVGESSAAYVAFCGVCDRLNTAVPFANGIATNVTKSGGTTTVGKKLSADGWRVAQAQGLPKRYITSVQIDPSDPATVYVTLAGYSRRWLPVGAGAEEFDPTPGSVFRSTDAGESFTNITGNLPDVPANWSAIRNGQLIVATNVGIFVSKDTAGGTWEVLGTGLPAAPTFTLELKPKARADEPDTLIAATQGRGVYRYAFADPPAAGGGNQGGGGQGGQAGAGTAAPGGGVLPGSGSGGATACAASSGFKSVSAKSSARGLRFGFERNTKQPVAIDVFRVSVGRSVIRERLVARFTRRSAPFTWTGLSNRGGARKRVGDGYYFARYRIRGQGDENDIRRIVVRRSRGRFSARPDFYRRANCDLLRTYKLERPVFGGRRSSPLGISYRVTARSRVQVVVTRGKRTVRRFAARTTAANRTTRLRLRARGLGRGDYKVRIVATSGKTRVRSTLTARRL